MSRNPRQAVITAIIAMAALAGCDHAAFKGTSTPTTPPEPAPSGRRTQSTDGVSNADAAGTGSQLPDAGTKGTNGTQDDQRAREAEGMSTPAKEAADPNASH
jgi:hypothetical protein